MVSLPLFKDSDPSLIFSQWPLQSWDLSTTTEVAPSPMASPGLSLCQASLPFQNPSVPLLSHHEIQYNMGDSHTPPSLDGSLRCSLGRLWGHSFDVLTLRKYFPETFTSMILVVAVTLLGHPLGEGVRRPSTLVSSSQWVAEKTCLFIKELGPAFIPPAKVLLTQAADSMLSFSRWCL